MERTTRQAWTGLGVPPAYEPAPVVGFTGRLTGRRVIISTVEGWQRDCRAWDEPVLQAGGPVLPCVTEWQWYEWRIKGTEPERINPVPIQAVWVEFGRLRS
jgi:hypothetical protein